MPIWAVIVLVLFAAIAGWVTGALTMGTFICSKVVRRLGQRQAEWVLRPEDEA